MKRIWQRAEMLLISVSIYLSHFISSGLPRNPSSRSLSL